MHWITMLGIVFMVAGIFLTYFGQNIKNRLDDQHLRQSISEKTIQIDELVNGNNELLTRINGYQETLLEKEKIIQQLEAQDGGLGGSPSEHDNNVIAQARSFYEEGKHDEAYKLANDLRQKSPGFGLAYFILGTIEVHKEHYDKGEGLLEKAIRLGLPDEDKARAFHDLGTISIRRKDFEKAKGLLEKAIESNAGMQKSRKSLELLNDHLRKKHAITHLKNLYREGRFDDAYSIADDLRQNNPQFGLVYFILGTIEMRKEHYDKGEGLLEKAIRLGLPDEDKARAFHYLGLSSFRKSDYEKAREFLENAIRLRPGMEESQKMLGSLDSLQEKERYGNDIK